MKPSPACSLPLKVDGRTGYLAQEVGMMTESLDYLGEVLVLHL